MNISPSQMCINRTSCSSVKSVVESEVLSNCERQFHNHVATCHERKAGSSGCRLNMPQEQRPRTRPVVLSPNPEGGVRQEDGSKLPHYLVEELELSDTRPKFHLMDVLERKVPKRIIVWEPERRATEPILGETPAQELSRTAILNKFQSCLGNSAEFSGWQEFWVWLESRSDDELRDFYTEMVERLRRANGYVTAFNVTLSRLTSFHNNVILLGSMDQAMGAIFYICPYMGKKKLPLEESLTVLYNSLQHCQKYPSRAKDEGTQRRNAVYLLERTLNQMNLKMELSHYQVVAQLLNLPTLLTTEKYAYMKPSAELAMAAVLRHPNNDLSKLILSQEEFLHAARDEAPLEDDVSVDSDDASFLAEDEDESSSSDDDSSDSGDEEETDNVKEHGQGTDPSTFAVPGSDLRQTSENRANDSMSASVPADTFDPNDLQNLLNGIGAHKCYVVEEPEDPSIGTPIKKFVPHSLLYNNRGRELRFLSRYEMAALVRLGVKPKDDTRARLKRFELAPSFILAARYAYVLQQKQCTPLLTSKMPPHPGPRPLDETAFATWKRKADAFAGFLLAVYRPEVDFYDAGTQENPYEYTYDALLEWIDDLQQDKNVLSKFRLIMIHRCVVNMKSDKVTSKCLTEYRSRSKDNWTKSRRTRSSPVFSNVLENLDDSYTEGVMPLTASELSDRMQRIGNFAKGWKRLAPKGGFVRTAKCGAMDRIPLPEVVLSARSSIDFRNVIGQIDNRAAYIKNMAKQEIPTVNGTNGGSSFGDRTSTTKPFKPNTQQKRIRDMIFNELSPIEHGRHEEADNMPGVTLLTGCAGTGKTAFLLWVKKGLEDEGCRVFTTTFNNINALHAKGSTTCSAIDFPHLFCADRLITLTPSQLQTFMEVTGINRNPDCVKLIFMDESSNYAPFHIANFEAGCRQATGINAPFGGIRVIFLGDLYQLGPVKAGMTLAQAVVQVSLHQHRNMVDAFNRGPRTNAASRKKIKLLPPDDKRLQPGHPFREGAMILRSARWFNFTKQERCHGDTAHTAFIVKLGTGGSITREDMQRYKHLSARDLEQEKWLRAPMISTMNHERLIYAHCRCLALAKYLDQPVIRWLANVRTKGPLDAVVGTDDPAYYEYFFASMKGYLSAGICKSLGLVNALGIRYHSIVPASMADRDKICAACRRGSSFLVTLDETPHCINVEIPPESLKDLPVGAADELRRISLNTDEDESDDEEEKGVARLPSSTKPKAKKIIIPVIPGASRSEPFRIFSLKEPLNRALDGKYRTHFPLEMNSVMTVNKAEGQTIIGGLILAVSKREKFDFRHNGVYVGMSRTESGDEVRLFLLGDTEWERQQSIEYLYKLQPDPAIKGLFAGFGGIPDPDNWTEREFSSVDLAAHFCTTEPTLRR